MALTETDYFADTAEVESLLKIGTSSGSTSFSETDLDAVLAIIQGEVHDYLVTSGLCASPPLLNTDTGYYTVKAVLTNLIQEWSDRRQTNKELQGAAGVLKDTIPELSIEMCGRIYRGIHKDDDNVDVIPLYRGNYHDVV